MDIDTIYENCRMVGDFCKHLLQMGIPILSLVILQGHHSKPSSSKAVYTIPGLRHSDVEPFDYQSEIVAARDSPTIVNNFEATIIHISEYGIVDLYSTLEDFVFKLYKAYLFCNPE